MFDLEQALRTSDRALSSIEKAEANYEELLALWDKHRSDKRVQNMLLKKRPPPLPKTIAFLKLFWEPEENRRGLSRFWSEKFGSKIVDRALEHLKFKQGDSVIVNGLKNSSELNGKRGVVRKWINDQRRYLVKLNSRKKPITILASNLKIDAGSDSSDGEDGAPMGKNNSKAKPKPTVQPKVNSPPVGLDSSDDDSDEPPPLNDRDQSSSDESSSDDSLPGLIERGTRSNSSDSSNYDGEAFDSDSSSSAGSPPGIIPNPRRIVREMRRHSPNVAPDGSSSSSSVPDLMRKDNSSSDDDDIPALINPNQQSSSSSDDSIGPQRRAQRGRASNPSTAGRGEGGGGRGAGGGKRKGGARGKGRRKRK